MKLDSAPETGMFPLEGLLSLLRLRGFPVGVTEHVRAGQVLAALPADLERAELKRLLAPVLAKSRDQQAEFDRVFDEYFETVSPAPEEVLPPAGQTPPTPPAPRALVPLSLAVAAVLGAAGLSWLAPLLPPAASPPAPAPPAGSLPEVPSWALTPPHVPTTGGVLIPQPGTRTVIMREFDAAPWWVQLEERWRTPLWLGAMLLPVALWGAFEWARRRRRKLAIARMLAEPPPRIWPIRLGGEAFDPFPQGELRRAVARLSRREESEWESLDMQASAVATASNGGVVELRFLRGTRAAEYLILIERRSERDHLAHFFLLLAERLRAGGLYADILFFHSDPRVCEGVDGRPYALDRLRAMWGGHRLLLFSSGEALTDPYSGLAVPWLSDFDGWVHRALLTPIDPAAWWTEEETLSQPFCLAPATLEGLAAAVDGFETSPLALSHWGAGAGRKTGGSLDALDRRQMELVRGCALFPELHWDLTLRLAERSGFTESGPASRDLLPVLRLPWFREGVIPERERFALINGLSEERERELRKEVSRVLETAEWPPEGSAAAMERSWWLRLTAAAASGSRRGVEQELERQRDGRLARDASVITLLQRPRGRTGFALPERLREMLYDAGVPAFGWRPWVRAAVAGLALVIGAVGLHALSRGSAAWRDAHQREVAVEVPDWSAPNAPRRIFDNPVDGLRYVWISPGEFVMGCSPGDTECDDDEKPAHPVRITKGFWMSESEVTQAAYQKVIRSNPSRFRGTDLPVENVAWREADAYCKAVGGRLPTEAEWEYAARGRDPRARYGELEQIAWHFGNSGSKTHPVKGLLPNRFGLYDMLGNVWEWTADWYGNYGAGAQADPKDSATGTSRALRGGSWLINSQYTRASNRGGNDPVYRSSIAGFRCARD